MRGQVRDGFGPRWWVVGHLHLEMASMMLKYRGEGVRGIKNDSDCSSPVRLIGCLVSWVLRESLVNNASKCAG